MNTRVIQTTKAARVVLPAGNYTGEWGGYCIVISNPDGSEYRLHTSDGLRGLAQVSITSDGAGHVEFKVIPKKLSSALSAVK